MNKEKGIYELLPPEPIDVASMLIKATIVTDAPERGFENVYCEDCKSESV